MNLHDSRGKEKRTVMTVQELYASIGADYNSALRLLRSDAMVARLIVKLPEDPAFDRLLTAWKSNDEAGIFEASHSMKGVYGNLGLFDISKAASVITQQYRPGSSRTMSEEELNDAFEHLVELHDTAVSAIHAFARQNETHSPRH